MLLSEPKIRKFVDFNTLNFLSLTQLHWQSALETDTQLEIKLLMYTNEGRFMKKEPN